MAYRFRSGHEESESGERVLQGRLHQQPFLPYGQPSTSAGPLALLATEQEARTSPGWLRGFISGAGKLISSVLGSEGSASSHSECDSDYSSDAENDTRANKHVDHLLSDGLAEFNKRKSVVNGKVEPLAIVSKSDSKLVIEQLLMQETFTRAEYGKLMTILQSRVLDIPSAEGGERAQNEVPKRYSDNGSWQLWNPNRNVFGTSDFSPSNPSVFTPRYYASEAVAPDPCSKAFPEAKKWFEQKKLSSSPICDQEYGPCSLNTDMNQYCFDGGDSTPIGMARSYMQSLSPWRSPSFGTTGFRTPPSSGKQPCSIGTHLFPSSKVRKRDYAATQAWEPKENSTVSLKSIDNEPRVTKWCKVGLEARSLIPEHFRGATATPSFSYEHADEYVKLHDREAVEVGHHREMHEGISRGIIMEPQVAFEEAARIPKLAAVETPKYQDISAMYCYDIKKPIAMQNKGVNFASVTNAQNGGIPAIQDSHVLVSAALGNGDSFTKTKTSLSEIVVPAEKSIQKSDSEVKVQADNAVEVNPNSDSKHTRSLTDSKPPDENPDPNPKDAITPAEEININGHPTEINNSNSHIESKSNSRGDVPKGTPEPPANSSGSLLSTQIAENNARHHTNVNNSNSHIESMSSSRVDVPHGTLEPPGNSSGSLLSTQIANNNARHPTEVDNSKSHIESMSNSRVDVPDGTPEPPVNSSGSLLSTQIVDNNARHPTEINNSNSHIESMSNSCVDVPDGTPEPPANFSGSLLATQISDNNARHPTEINNNNSHIESMGNSRVDVPDGTPEPPANISCSLPSSQIANNNASAPQDEKMKKSMERAESGGKRSAKKVVRQKRWKG